MMGNEMPPEMSVEHPPLSAWQVQVLRLTGFPSPAAPVQPDTWWRDLTNESPETRTSQLRTGGLKEEGAYGRGKLALAVEPTRVDWLLASVPDEKLEAGGLHNLGQLTQTLESFQHLMERWFKLKTFPLMQRLAFGAVLLQPKQSLGEGYRQLEIYLSPFLKLDPERSSDFLYRINRRRNSKISINGLQMNRLSTWSVASTSLVEFSVGAVAGGSIRSIPGLTLFACRLELDINTHAEFRGEFSAEHSGQIFQELVELGLEIARKGDIP
jgi:hypothetical protein